MVLIFSAAFFIIAVNKDTLCEVILIDPSTSLGMTVGTAPFEVTVLSSFCRSIFLTRCLRYIYDACPSCFFNLLKSVLIYCRDDDGFSSTHRLNVVVVMAIPIFYYHVP